MQPNKPVMNFFNEQVPSARRALLPLAGCVLLVLGYFALPWLYSGSPALAAYLGLACLYNIAIGTWFCALLGRRS